MVNALEKVMPKAAIYDDYRFMIFFWNIWELFKYPTEIFRSQALWKLKSIELKGQTYTILISSPTLLWVIVKLESIELKGQTLLTYKGTLKFFTYALDFKSEKSKIEKKN